MVTETVTHHQDIMDSLVDQVVVHLEEHVLQLEVEQQIKEIMVVHLMVHQILHPLLKEEVAVVVLEQLALMPLDLVEMLELEEMV